MDDHDHDIVKADNYTEEIRERLATVAKRLKALGVKTALLDDRSSVPFETTNDIDFAVSSLKDAVNIFAEAGFFIQLRPLKNSNLRGLPLPEFRACYRISDRLLTIDLIHVEDTPHSIWAGLYNANDSHPLIGLPMGAISARIAWKTYKYFGVGNLGQLRQLQRLQKQWDSLKEYEDAEATNLIEALPEGGNVLFFQKTLMKAQSEEALREIIADVRKTEGYKEKEDTRVVLAGQLIGGKRTSLKLVSYAFIKKWFGRYRISSFPVIAFVGNDGGGKTSTIGELSSHTLHKIDPIVVSMKRKDPFFVFTKVIKAVLIPLKQNQRVISVFGFLSGPANWILEVVDYFDRLVRFRLGLLWARCGLGPVFFDRYVTDRLRGEYCRDNFRLHPLEQFFPMPDSFIFFDVPAEVSMERKPEDNHNLTVLHEKRLNYLRLMKEISRVHYIDGTSKPVDVHESANVFILSMCREKNVRKGERWERAVWTPS